MALMASALRGGRMWCLHGARSRALLACRPLCAAAAAPEAPRLSQRELQQRRKQAADPWPGLGPWRAARVDERVVWGDRVAAEPSEPEAESAALGASLAACARQVLLTADPREKARVTHLAWRAYKAGTLPIGTAEPPGAPARPTKPELVPPKQIPSMKFSPLPMNVYMLHNLAHIELNAIDLAWDTVVRFSGLGLPEAFYADFARVADDEARHLLWCLQRMGELGFEYGCMPAHNLLWEGAEASADDLFARLAIVPMSQEARGLDAGKRLAERLVGWGDNRSAAIVHQIALEERNHVAVGVTWFQAICGALGVDPGPAFRGLLLELCPDLLKGPFNDEERGVAGLPRDWYDTSRWPEGERAIIEQLRQPKGGAAPAAAVAQDTVVTVAAAAAEPAAPAALAGAAAVQDAQQARQQWQRACVIPPQLAADGEQLQRLRQRLAALLEIELSMSN